MAVIFYSPAALLSGSPFVVSRACHMKQLTSQLNGIPLFLVRLPDCGIDVALSYFRKASLLFTSSNFLAGHAPFPPDTACAELLNLNLRLLQFGSGGLILLPLPAPVFQTGFAHLPKPQSSCAHLLVAYLVLQGHLTVVLSTGQTVLDNLNAFFLGGVPSLLHVASFFS